MFRKLASYSLKSYKNSCKYIAPYWDDWQKWSKHKTSESVFNTSMTPSYSHDSISWMQGHMECKKKNVVNQGIS